MKASSAATTERKKNDKAEIIPSDIDIKVMKDYFDIQHVITGKLEN